MAKKTPQAQVVLSQRELILKHLTSTGLTVLAMTPADMDKTLPSHVKALKCDTFVDAYEMSPLMDDATAHKRQIVLVYDEKDVDKKSYVCIKLFDKVMNLTTMDPKQIKISSNYVTRMNYRIPNDEQAIDIIGSNVLDNVMSFRKLIDDPSLV